MRKKYLVFLLILAIFSQTGFAMREPNPPNVALSDKQEVFKRISNEESGRIRRVDFFGYLSEEQIVRLCFNQFRWMDVTRDSVEATFSESGSIYDFEVQAGIGYTMTNGPSENLEQGYLHKLTDSKGNLIYLHEMIRGDRSFEIGGNTLAYSSPLFLQRGFSSPEFYFASLPDVFSEQIVEFDRYLAMGEVMPQAYDLSFDGSKLFVLGSSAMATQRFQSETESASELWIEQLEVPTASNLEERQEEFLSLKTSIEESTWPKFKVEITEYEGNQNLEVRDMYVTDRYVIVLFHENNQNRAFVQRYTYSGELIDQIETNYRTRRIAEGSNGSTFYLQKRFTEPVEGEMREDRQDWQLEIVQINWNEKETTRSGGMRPVIAERTFGGRTLARFTDNGFGLLKQVEEETGIVDYRAPLKAKTNDVRLQIPYADLMAKAGMGARDLVLTYQGQDIAISFELLLSANLDEMPCQDDATIEIHLKADEEGIVTYTIELFVVEQVNAMTKVVHRKTIQ